MMFDLRIANASQRLQTQRMCRSVPVSVADNTEIPKIVDPYDWPLKEENQGMMGSCGGQGQVHMGEVCHYHATGEEIEFCPLFAYFEANRQSAGRYEMDDHGSTIDSNLKVAHEIGFVLRNAVVAYPDTSGWQFDRTGRPTPQTKAAFQRCVREYQRAIGPEHFESAGPYRLPFMADMLRGQVDPFDLVARWIGSKCGAIELGSSWAPPTFGQGEFNGRRVRTMESCPDSGGGHAWAVDGYAYRVDPKTPSADDQLVGMNSHGDGRMCFTRREFEQICRQRAQYGVFAGSRMERPRPRRWMAANKPLLAPHLWAATPTARIQVVT